MRIFSHKKRGFRMICATFCLFAAHRQNIGCLILHRANIGFAYPMRQNHRPATIDFPTKTNFFDFLTRQRTRFRSYSPCQLIYHEHNNKEPPRTGISPSWRRDQKNNERRCNRATATGSKATTQEKEQMSTIHPLKIDLLKIPGARKFQSKDGTWHVAIPHPSVYIGEKGAYLDCDLTERRQIDDYKNTHNIAMTQSKEDRQAKAAKIYIGNGKTLTFGNSQQSAPAKKDDTWIDDSDDSTIPF